MSLSTHEAWQIADAVNNSELNPLDIAEEFITRIDAQNDKLNALLFWDSHTARKSIERQWQCTLEMKKQGKSLRLAGVPVVVKDNILVKDHVKTCASRILEGFKSPFDATVVQKLRQEGALILASANMDEFAMGSSNENSAYGPVRNPMSTDFVAGGSSGGSAASVAASFAPVALGSDTGGSIRQPASFCGLVGLKPSYGAVSRFGLVSYASSFDQIGPITRTVRDTALLCDILRGHDKRDSSSVAQEYQDIEPSLSASKSLDGMTIGVVDECFQEGLDAGVKGSVDSAIKDLEALGAKIKRVSIPSVSYGVSIYYILTSSEASSNLARYDGVRFGKRMESNKLQSMYEESRSQGFGKEVKQRIMLGTYALSSGYYDAYYQKASRLRESMTREVNACFKEVDLLLSPTSPQTASKIGEVIDDPMTMYLRDVYTIIANLCKIPAISVPCGVDELGLPIGLQLMSPRFKEDQLLKGAFAYEQFCKSK